MQLSATHLPSSPPVAPPRPSLQVINDLGARQASFQHTDELQLLHIGLLREYIGLELRLRDIQWHPPHAPPPPQSDDSKASVSNVERLIDDFVVMCFLLGNDFLPHLATADLDEDGEVEKN